AAHRPAHGAPDLRRRAPHRRLRRPRRARSRRRPRPAARSALNNQPEGKRMTDAQNAPNNQNNQPVFSIEKVYVKDLSLEVPNAPQVFLEREAPTVDIQLHHNSTRVEDGVYQTVLTVTVTAKVHDKTMFLIEAAQAGIFVARNIPP